MASKLYPTLSSFYKAGNVGFGSEKDAILCGVPEEKLYRKPSRHRTELPSRNPPGTNTRVEPSAQSKEESAPPSTATTDSHNDTASPTLPRDGADTAALTPSAPPLLEMLDARLQQYLDVLLTTTHSNCDNTPLAFSSDSSPSSLQQRATVTLPLPPNVVVEDAWLDELQPDYDDLAPEEMTDEILNNLNVVREEDSKDHEKQKSLSLLRMSSTTQDSPAESARQEQQRGQPPHQQRQQQPEERRRRHSYQNQPSVNSREYNEDMDTHFHNHHHHHQQHQQQHQPQRQHHHGKSHGAARLQGPQSQSREDLRLGASRAKRQDSGEKQPSAKYEAEDKGRGRDARDIVHQHRRSKHAAHSRTDLDQCVSDPVDGHQETSRHSPRGKTSAVEKENHHGRLGLHGENSDYNAWMTWRKQVNRQLATIILLKQQGKEVSVQTTDMRRKPLRQSSIDFVSQIATQNGSTTSLGGKPYVMYGIPRASLLPKNEPSDSNKDNN